MKLSTQRGHGARILVVAPNHDDLFFPHLGKALLKVGCEVRLCVVSQSYSSDAQKIGIAVENIASFEDFSYSTQLDWDDVLFRLQCKYKSTDWCSIPPMERRFTDYSFLFGATGHRRESSEYILSLVARLATFFESSMDDWQPDILVTAFGDNIFTYTATLLAEAKVIRVFLPQPCYLNENGAMEGGYFGNTRFLEPFSMVRSYLQLLGRDLTETERHRADAFMEGLKYYEGSKTLAYIYKSSNFESPLSPNLSRLFSYLRANASLDTSVHYYKIDLFGKIRANWLRYWRNMFLRWCKELLDAPLPERFVFFPMHFQPEASTLVNGVWYTNQVALIENISKSLPLGYSLVVKEHPRGRGARPMWQYKHISSLYNVSFSDLPSKEILSKSGAVVTISGSVGIEAMAFDKPVILLGRTFHSYNRLYSCVRDVSALPEIFRKLLLDRDEEKDVFRHREEARKFVLSYLNGTFPFFPSIDNADQLALLLLEEWAKDDDSSKTWLEELHGTR